MGALSTLHRRLRPLTCSASAGNNRASRATCTSSAPASRYPFPPRHDRSLRRSPAPIGSVPWLRAKAQPQQQLQSRLNALRPPCLTHRANLSWLTGINKQLLAWVNCHRERHGTLASGSIVAGHPNQAAKFAILSTLLTSWAITL